jgi:hypothetical protein
MQANFIESSPLPVKAVLAMTGHIEEIYRLPLLPMRRDTRLKLQKVAIEAGLLTALASPRISFFMRAGRSARTSSSCIALPVDNAIMAGGAPPATSPIMRAGTDLMRRWRRRGRSATA